jgi:hypothetical protein
MRCPDVDMENISVKWNRQSEVRGDWIAQR